MSLCVALLSGVARFVNGGVTHLWVDIVFIVSAAVALTLAVGLLGYHASRAAQRHYSEHEPREDERREPRRGGHAREETE